MKTHTPVEEKILSPRTNGLAFLLLNTLAIILSIAAMVIAFVLLVPSPVMVILIVVTMLYAFLVGPLLYIGLKIVKPNEAIVLTLFGRYMGTIKEEGFYWVHPFATAVCPVSASDFSPSSGKTELKRDLSKSSGNITVQLPKRKISLKATTLNNDKQKVNDALGNPIIIGVVVVWRVVNTAFAVFNVENYIEYLSIQCDAALR
ncbi:MAG: SPFH domain-containing protein, partial [Sphaerochaeta sp.]|nr:SPFH domain-containing protein [Sphaerochaeta sp.]